ncbi:phosphonate ABC transporter ATP-binding protein [Verminephrobacter aporrectodeae subsp. tuberculatae]|uniref:Phosphonate ABC transporter ATP-binding protein n=1 Tax=Verminephrobacter aporrectodeae subsp. tuberculatae TaxID=1110392 RepID=A0ABT3KV31_9BURK|nr:phosphonate ABC transporter ATP-binding protein [Verminephrobacter aporrectodeae]MCW5223153.1 phosphonate ABC transporter ATP-binding protein [Verminephrobacter aporrectodeae subsp. tuberculatae]MCW5256629.1 phosphonate ABC transporter ATP-binding protein [Verminephrobacter aporrectodeae subsp. tuberculatae]MCW5288617.1 phosphonate ABC transporter ATP-binding protein [Verminephrobacter aporrectodeae subsp. tuberculatae]MCW5322206.1 phosphonate ABC transporter ATP-binding protein [Verminephro
MPAALHIHRLNKHFPNGRQALRDVSLTVQHGEMVALIGASGSGKSTLLRHVAGLVAADAQSPSLIEIDGCCVQQGGRIHHDIRRLRAQVGFVFQQFNLVDRLPVLMNVLVGLLHRIPRWRSWLRLFQPQECALALEALARVGIADCHAQRASTLSGGQQQRAAIARTLVQGAKVVLADEPIASLDPESSRKVMDILARINREDRCTVIVSLHQVDVAIKYCPRVVALHHGQVVYDGASSALTPALLRRLYGVQADEILADAAPPAAAPCVPSPTPQWTMAPAAV